MHPCGKLDQATYQLIGAAYSEVAEKEAWCAGVTNVAEVAFLSSEAVFAAKRLSGPGVGSTDAGVVRVLQEGGVLYDVADVETDLTPYQVVILPDSIPVDGALQTKLTTYLQQGGKILATGSSALNADGTFAFDFGATVTGDSPTSPSYIVPRFPLESWDSAAFVVYAPAKMLHLTTGAVLADLQDAYFNRDLLHFCSHQHAPNTGQTASPVMVATGNTVYLGYPAFQLYAEWGQTVLRDILLHGLRQLLTAPILETDLPAQGIQTVQQQAAGGRTVVHLLYASPVRRGKNIEVIEDLLPLYDIAVALRVAKTPTRVYLAPQQEDLPFTLEDGMMKTIVPVLLNHQMVVVE